MEYGLRKLFVGAPAKATENPALEADELRLRLARALFSQQRYDEAMAELRPLLAGAAADEPDFRREAERLRLDILRERKDYDALLQAAAQMLREDPDNHDAALARADILLRTGKARESAEAFAKLAQDASNDAIRADALTGLGRAQLAAGERAAARPRPWKSPPAPRCLGSICSRPRRLRR